MTRIHDDNNSGLPLANFLFTEENTIKASQYWSFNVKINRKRNNSNDDNSSKKHKHRITGTRCCE